MQNPVVICKIISNNISEEHVRYIPKNDIDELRNICDEYSISKDYFVSGFSGKSTNVLGHFDMIFIVMPYNNMDIFINILKLLHSHHKLDIKFICYGTIESHNDLIKLNNSIDNTFIDCYLIYGYLNNSINNIYSKDNNIILTIQGFGDGENNVIRAQVGLLCMLYNNSSLYTGHVGDTRNARNKSTYFPSDRDHRRLKIINTNGTDITQLLKNMIQTDLIYK